jgi:hypothetical protein
MISAHLACFAWRTPTAGAELIRLACGEALSRGFPGLFTAVDQRNIVPLEQSLGQVEKVIAPATVYGAGLQPGAPWNINSSEI